jgi:hypothetical protein
MWPQGSEDLCEYLPFEPVARMAVTLRRTAIAGARSRMASTGRFMSFAYLLQSAIDRGCVGPGSAMKGPSSNASLRHSDGSSIQQAVIRSPRTGVASSAEAAILRRVGPGDRESPLPKSSHESCRLCHPGLRPSNDFFQLRVQPVDATVC